MATGIAPINQSGITLGNYLPFSAAADWSRNRAFVTGYQAGVGPGYALVAVDLTTRAQIAAITIPNGDNIASVVDANGYYYNWYGVTLTKYHPTTLAAVGTYTGSVGAGSPDNVGPYTISVYTNSTNWQIFAALFSSGGFSVINLDTMTLASSGTTIPEGVSGAGLYRGAINSNLVYSAKVTPSDHTKISLYQLVLSGAGGLTVTALSSITAASAGVAAFNQVMDGFVDQSDGNLCLLVSDSSSAYRLIKVNVASSAVVWALPLSIGTNPRLSQWQVTNGVAAYLDGSTLRIIDLTTGASNNIALNSHFATGTGAFMLYDSVSDVLTTVASWSAANPPVLLYDSPATATNQWIIFQNVTAGVVTSRSQVVTHVRIGAKRRPAVPPRG